MMSDAVAASTDTQAGYPYPVIRTQDALS